MFERRKWHRITALVLSLTMLFTSIPAMAFAESQGSSEEPDAGYMDVPMEEVSLEDTLILEEGLSEENVIPEESTESSTTFDLGDGRKTTIFHGQQIRFENKDGELVDYEPSLIATKSAETDNGFSLEGYRYENKTGDVKHYLPEELNEDTPVLTENGDYAISMSPYKEKEKKEKVKQKKDEILTPYEQIEEKNLTAVYEGDTFSYEYQSQNRSVKETLILNEVPESFSFSYLLTAKGMNAKLLDSGVIVFEDKENDKDLAYIEKPFMNDATGEAYSEDIQVSMEKKSTGKYIVTYTLSEAYLCDKERVYPVYVDPTATWKGNDEFRDIYVISGDYADINFYDSDIRLMVAGKGIDGTYRTYIQIPNLKGTLDGELVESAYITVYESGDCEANQTIRFNRITESWTASSLTWNNKPAYNSTSINSFTTEGTQYAAHKVKVTNTIRNYINSTNHPNYGIVMRNVTSSPDFAEFYGSRTSLTSYRPKLVVTHSDKPTAPTSVTVSKSYLTTDEKLKVTWKGIASAGLERVQYRIAKYNDDGTVANSTYVPWTNLETTSESSGSATIDISSYANNGNYRIYIRGVDVCDNIGSSSYAKFYTDRTAPSYSSIKIEPAGTTAEAPSQNLTPTISWDIKEKNLKNVKLYIDEETDNGLVMTSTKNEGSFTVTLNSGSHRYKFLTTDKAGNTKSYGWKEYHVDTEKPLTTMSVSPNTSANAPNCDTTPVIQWETDYTDIEDITLTINDKVVPDISATTRQWEDTTGTWFATSGTYTIRLTVTDRAGNYVVQTKTYYLDINPPAFSSLEMTKSSFLFPSANRAPVITWDSQDSDVAAIYYSVDGGQYNRVLTDGTKSLTLPESVWGNKTKGRFTISVYAEDTAGNTGPAKTLNYYLKPADDPEDYLPKDMDVVESYGKRVITWDLAAYDSTKASYALYRGESADFTPSAETLIVEDFNVAAGLYIDNEILKAGDCFYKIVVTDLTGDEGAENYTSEAVAFENDVTIEQFSNRIGFKDYLSYLEIGLPTGTMHVEESSGNIAYEQNDYSFTAPVFSMDMDRTYNSMSKATSMVGAGWSDSYHQEIYSYSNDLYFVDTDGSAYFFERQANDSFACDETKEMMLEKTNSGYTITSKDKVISTFNESGQLITTTEPNGYVLENVYDQMGRLAEVRLIHGETEIRNLEFAYIENSYLLDSVILPDESVMEYSYSGESLTSAVYGGITYAYQYDDNGLLNTVYDGEGNPYTVSYEDGKVIQTTYPDGEKFQLAYNVDNKNKTEIKKFAADGGHFYTESTTFDPQTGKLLSHNDPAGEAVSYAYRDENNPYLLTESSKEVSYYTLDEETEKVYESEAKETVLSGFVYDGNGNITSETSEDGSVTTYTYCTSTEENPNLVKYEITKRDGMTTSEMDYVYDERGNVKQTTDRVSRQVTDYILDDYGNVLTETVRENGITLSISVNTYDIYGNVLSTESTEGGITTSTAYTYDIMGKILTTVSPGAETSYTYDEAGREIETETEEEGLEPVITTKSYDDNSALLSENSSNGIACEYSYDDRNRVISQIVSGEDMEPRTTVTDYGTVGPAGNKVYMETVTTSGSASLFSSNTDSQTQIRYIDGTGKVLKEVDDMVQTEYTYDKAGNVLSAETATSDQGMVILEDRAAESVNTDDTVLTLYNKYGEAEVFITESEAASDAAYRLSEDSLVSRQSFDGAGNLKIETSPMGITATYSYDTQGRLTGCDVDGDGTNDTTVSYSLTATGNTVTTITDANGNVRTETMNAAGLLLETRDVASEEGTGDLYTQYIYDTQGRKMKEAYSDGSRIEYSYTSGNSARVFTETAFRADGTEESCITYAYDDYGRTSSITVTKGGNAVSTTSWTYDAEGKKLSETVSYGNQLGQTTQYTYDVFGRLASVQYPDESGLGTVTYTYDIAGNISKISNGEGTIREYGYVHMGQIDYIRDYRTPKTESVTPPYIDKYYSYDNNGRTTAMRTQDADGVILETFSYEYDQNSQIIEEIHVNNLPEEAKQINETTSYTYDDFGRLTQSVKTDHQNSNVRLVTAYGYDDVGNRISMTENGAETAYTYNSLNQLLSSAENGENTTYAYDGRGNQITETKDNVVTESTYSVRGEMLTLTKKSEDTVIFSQENAYNHDGIRIIKKEDGNTRYYYYDNGVIVYTRDGTALSSANIAGPEGQVVGTFRGADYHVYLKDIQGSTTNIVKQDGSLSAAYKYSDFGETAEITGSSFDNEICYTGAVYDDTTGLYYMNARYYNPANGRFISQDTYRGDLKNPAQWHLYAYCANNPINYTDPSGHKVATVIIMLGYRITKSVHYSRNQYNTNLPKNGTTANKKWVKQKEKHSACHQFHAGKYKNVKYLSPDGHKEAVYKGTAKNHKQNHGGKLVTNEEDKGTYNFGVGTGAAHGVLDVAPYILWGNSLKDKTNIVTRIVYSSSEIRNSIWNKIKKEIDKYR